MSGVIYDPFEGLVKMLLSLILVVFVIFLSFKFRLQLEREIAAATFRSVVQLMAVVMVIAAVFQSGNLLLVLLVLAVMVVIAAETSAKRVEGINKPFIVTFSAIAAGSGIALLFLVLLGVIPIEPEFLIPVGSMTIGGCMIICSLAMNRFSAEIKAHYNEIETALCLGATQEEAIRPFLGESVKAALIPSIDRLKTLGIVVLPGTMAGMIISGVDPIWAAEYQLVIMFLLLGSGCITALIATTLTQKYLNITDEI